MRYNCGRRCADNPTLGAPVEGDAIGNLLRSPQQLSTLRWDRAGSISARSASCDQFQACVDMAAVASPSQEVPPAVQRCGLLAAKFCVEQDPSSCTDVSNSKTGVHCFCTPLVQHADKDSQGAIICSVFVYARQSAAGQAEQRHYMMFMEVSCDASGLSSNARMGFARQMGRGTGSRMQWTAPQVRSRKS